MSATADCPEFASWPALLGDTLPPEERARYERHLEGCPTCQNHLDGCDECEEAWRRLAREVGDPTVIPADPTLTVVMKRAGSVFGVGPEHQPSNAERDPADLYFLRPADRPDLLGMLGSYEVQEVIGEGGMGVVLKAYEPALHRLVAIKVLAAAVAGSATARRRFTREAQAAAAVCHDHIVPVHGVHETDGLPYLVMQYVAGESLQGRLDRTGPLDVTEVVRIALQTASGLAAAHAQGLIHRDIKPANLLLENCLARVKITDFGLARMADDAPLTQPGVVAGTPEYMSAEQARGESVDHRADLFSLGSVIYAMCTGKPPFRAASAVAVLRQVSDVEPVAIRALNPELPAWLEQFVARLMAKAPADRFQSAGDVAAMLEGYLAHLRQPATFSAPELQPLPPADPPPAAGEAIPSPTEPVRLAVRWPAIAGVLVAVVGVVVLWLGGIGQRTAGGDAVPSAGVELVQDFRGSQSPSDPWRIFGPDADEVVRPEAGGLRVTFPAGRLPADPAGVVSTAGIAGDFDIWVGYELIQVEQPTKGWGCGLEFYIMTDTPMGEAMVLTRGKRVKQGDGYYCSRNTTIDGKRKYITKDVPGFPTVGRLRMTRTGGEVTLWAAEGTGEFQELGRFNLGPEDVKMVRLGAHPGVGQNAIDLRITDVKVHSAAALHPAATTTRGRPWLTAVGVVFLALAGAAFRFWWVRRDRGTPVEGRIDGAEGPQPSTARFNPPAARSGPGRALLVTLIAIGLLVGAIAVGIVNRQTRAIDGQIEAATVAPTSPPPASTFDVWSVTISKDGKVIVAGGGLWEQPGEIGIWDAGTYQPLQRFTEEGGVASVVVSPDGKTVASGGWSGHVRLRDWAAGKVTADFEIPGVPRVAFSPAGDLLATATEAKTVQLWDVARRELIADLEGDKFRYHCVTFSPDGKRLLVGGGDWKVGGVAQVNVWDVASRQQIQKLTGHRNTILSVACSHDGKLIATASLDQTIHLWDSDTGRCLRTLTGHTRWVESVAFSANDKTLVSGSHDLTVRFWNVETGTETGRIATPVTIRTVQLTADGKTVLAGGIFKVLLAFDAANRGLKAALWDGRPSITPAATAIDTLPPAEPSPGRHKGWLAAALIGAFTIMLTCTAWIMVRRKRGSVARERSLRCPDEAAAEAAPPALIQVKCPGCGATAKAPANYAGKKGKCPKCGAVVVVRNASSGASADSTPDDRAKRPSDDEPATGPPRTVALTKWRIVQAIAVISLISAGVWFLRSPKPQAAQSFLNVSLGNESVPGVEEEGFSFQEIDRLQHRFRWTDGKAKLAIPLDKTKPPQTAIVEVAAYRPAGVKIARLEIVANGRSLSNDNTPVGKLTKLTLDLRGLDLGEQLNLEVLSDTFVPLGQPDIHGPGISDDTRTLGVQVHGITLLGAADEARSPPIAPSDFLDRPLGLESIPGMQTDGLFDIEAGRVQGSFRWTNGAAKLTVPLDAQPPRTMRVLLGMTVPRDVRLAINVNGRSLFDEQFNMGLTWARTFDLSDMALGREMAIEILSDTRVPAEIDGGGDQRTLGVCLRGIILSAAASFVNVPLGVREILGVEDEGFYHAESSGNRPFRWTNGTARLRVPVRGRTPQALALTLEAPERPNFHVRISVDGQTLFDGVRPPGQWSVELPLSGAKLTDPAVVEIETSTVSPAEGKSENKDNRTLGVRVYRLMLTDIAPAEAK